MNSRSITSGRLLAILFALLILSISLASLVNLNAGRSEAEKRSLASAPRLALDRESLSTFARSFEQFFADRFGFRQQFVYLNSLIHVQLLGTSPIDKVVVGSEGWLFYADEQTMTTDPLTPPLLELWRTALEAKQAWLGAQGIDYVFMVVPDKHTVYPEFLPRNRRPNGTPSNLDLLIDYLKHTSTVHVLDVRPRLLKAKAVAPVYYKTDTHWNRFGAAVACEELLCRVAEHNPAIAPMAMPSGPPGISQIKGRDIAAMVLMQNLMKDTEVDPGVAIGNARFITNEETTPEGLLTRSVNNQGKLPRAVVFHDSYFNAIKPYFAEHFSSTFMVGGFEIHKFPLEAIQKEQPKLVVEEIVERYLTGSPYLPQEIRQWHQEKKVVKAALSTK